VLACLRHHAVVGGHQQQRVVDAGGAGQHGVHQPFVARHVDEADAFGAAAAVQEGVAQFDADAALLFLGQAVGVDAGERAHQRGLAVVDVACGADDHQVHLRKRAPAIPVGRGRQSKQRRSWALAGLACEP
jgi:hypothetical protein